MKKDTLKKLMIVAIGLAVFVGIPWFFDAPWTLWISWFPALLVMSYLED